MSYPHKKRLGIVLAFHLSKSNRMKRLLITTCAILIISLNATAQKKTTTSAVKAPEVVQTNFKSTYPEAGEAKWTKNHSGNFAVTFKHTDGKTQFSEYDADGKLLKSTIQIPVEAVNPEHQESIKALYADATITAFTKYEIEGVTPYYKVTIQQPDQSTKSLLMSEEGTITE